MNKVLRRCLLGVFAVIASVAQAETTLCTEVVPPTVITQPGVYCLFKDYALSLASGAAIRINAHNVVLDMNGHRLGNGAAGTQNSARGVWAADDFGQGFQNISIRNGTVRGFHTGVYLSGVGGVGYLVEDMLIDQNLERGVYVDGQGSVVRRNRIFGTGITSTLNSFVGALYAAGSGVTVADNEISNTKSRQEVFGIQVAGSGWIVTGNRLKGLVAGDSFYECGICGGGLGVISESKIVDAESPSGGTTTGIYVYSGSNVKLIDNVVIVQGTPYAGGTQIAGTNN